MCLGAQSFSCVRLCVTSWTVACQASLSVGFSKARTLEWVAISYSRGIFLTHLLHWPADCLPLSHLGRPKCPGVTADSTEPCTHPPRGRTISLIAPRLRVKWQPTAIDRSPPGKGAVLPNVCKRTDSHEAPGTSSVGFQAPRRLSQGPPRRAPLSQVPESIIPPRCG